MIKLNEACCLYATEIRTPGKEKRPGEEASKEQPSASQGERFQRNQACWPPKVIACKGSGK